MSTAVEVKRDREKERTGERERDTKRKRDIEKERKLLVARPAADGMKRVLTQVPGQRPHIWIAKENARTRVLCQLRPGYGR